MISFKDVCQNILEQQKSVSLRFLNLEEQSYLQNKKDCILYGGYENAERKRAYFFGNKEDNIIQFQIDYNKKHLVLTHQNILGTLLSLGITHDSIGDILPKQNTFFVTKEISEEIKRSFTEINHVPIKCSVSEKKVENEQEFEERKTTLDSLRLDLVVSKICNISRSKADEIISKELVKINHHITTKSTTKLKEQDILSIRKHGRFILTDTKNTSRKGKIILKYSKYI